MVICSSNWQDQNGHLRISPCQLLLGVTFVHLNLDLAFRKKQDIAMFMRVLLFVRIMITAIFVWNGFHKGSFVLPSAEATAWLVNMIDMVVRILSTNYERHRCVGENSPYTHRVVLGDMSISIVCTGAVDYLRSSLFRVAREMKSWVLCLMSGLGCPGTLPHQAETSKCIGAVRHKKQQGPGGFSRGAYI
jgi:hypothetical protein